MQGSHRGRRRWQVLTAVGLLLGSAAYVPFVGGCNATDAEEKPGEAGKRRSQTARAKFKEIERQMAKLPQYTPAQKLAYEEIRSAYKFAKINFEAKSRARLNNVTVEVFSATMARITEIEKKLKKFPR